ncbi:Uncharacterised protein [Vibrio cholerae]|nr:Uncharacterised protein [Vibrio cholerae]
MIGAGIPRPCPIPIMAIPAVPAAPQEVPVARAVNEQITIVANKKIEG